MIGALIDLVIYVIVIGVILWLCDYLLSVAPMSEPFRRVAKIALTVIGVLILIGLLLNFSGLVGHSQLRIR